MSYGGSSVLATMLGLGIVLYTLIEQKNTHFHRRVLRDGKELSNIEKRVIICKGIIYLLFSILYIALFFTYFFNECFFRYPPLN
ncbi:hypothetical protein [Oceanobacillus chungangensis]